MVPTVLEQKVTSVEAHRAYARLVRAHGQPAPGPNDALRLPPTVAELVDAAVVRLARGRGRAASGRDGPGGVSAGARRSSGSRRGARRRSSGGVTSLAGIGPWTATSVAGLAFGDPDTVVVGDYHLPSIVAWNLVGERRADDARMLELLEPFRPHRARAVALIARAGAHPPRRAPRRALRDIRRI